MHLEQSVGANHGGDRLAGASRHFQDAPVTSFAPRLDGLALMFEWPILEPESGGVTAVPVPGYDDKSRKFEALAWDGTELWALDATDKRICAIRKARPAQ